MCRCRSASFQISPIDGRGRASIVQLISSPCLHRPLQPCPGRPAPCIVLLQPRPVGWRPALCCCSLARAGRRPALCCCSLAWSGRCPALCCCSLARAGWRPALCCCSLARSGRHPALCCSYVHVHLTASTQTIWHHYRKTQLDSSKCHLMYLW